MSCNVGLRLTSSKVPRTASHLKRGWGTRSLHRRKELPYSIENGLGDFLPPSALKQVALDYQEGLLQRLNDEVRGTADENATLVQTIINAAPHREQTLTFNYASLALNNSYFLDQLKPPPSEPFVTHQTEISQDLGSALRLQHGSIAQFKSAFSAAATGMFTNGYLWFVTDANGNTGIIPTLGAGTLLVRSRSYMAHSKDIELGADLKQYDRGSPYYPSERGERPGEGLYLVDANEPPVEPEDFVAEDPNAPQVQWPPTSRAPPPGVGPHSPVSGVRGASTPPTPSKVDPRFMHTTAVAREEIEQEWMLPKSVYDADPASRAVPRTKPEMLHLGEVLYPLFCLSVHEHAWMAAGYGVWGKEEWLKKFWTVLDWQKVSQSYKAVFDPRTN